MKTIFGLFETYQQADSTLRELDLKGVTKEDVSVIAQEEALHTNEATETTKDAGYGAGIGGLVGLVAGAASIALPGIGAIIGAGSIAGGLIGGAGVGSLAGGLVGFFRDIFGLGDEYSSTVEAGLKQGHILIAVNTNEENSEAIVSSMQDHGVKNLHTHEHDQV